MLGDSTFRFTFRPRGAKILKVIVITMGCNDLDVAGPYLDRSSRAISG
jgi:hypothetical protein